MSLPSSHSEPPRTRLLAKSGKPRFNFHGLSERKAAEYASAKAHASGEAHEGGWAEAFADEWPPSNPCRTLSNTKWNARPRA